jgi:exodeoxyribonuclease V alpha subunit
VTEPATVSAEVVAVRWRADDGGFAVIAALSDDGEEVTLVGPLGHLVTGDVVEVAGSWREHARHGRQLHAERVRVGTPASEDALVTVLAGVKHVGPRGAAWLVEHHGLQVLEVVDRDAVARLREVPGIGRARLQAAVASWQEQAGGRAVRLLLEDHGVPAAVATRVHKALGGGAMALIEADPYALAKVDGLGFATADAIARALGTPEDATARLEAGLAHALVAAEQDGHCHLPRADLLARGSRLLTVTHDVLAQRLDAAIDRADLVLDAGARVLTPRMDRTERALARRVRELLEAPPTVDVDVPEDPPAGLGGDEPPTPTQWSAVRAAVEHRLSILTGLPGTGKTATMRALVDLLRDAGRVVRLCAPTGKAARRLAEVTGADATTIHRLLEYVPGEGFARDASDPLTGVDLLVVDEASMIDVRLAAALLDAVGPRTHVLLVGDVDQLAPVGPGRFLEDLLEVPAVPATRLTEVFRQAARSLIIRAAHAVNRGEVPPTQPREDDLRDFFVVRREGATATFDEVVSLAAERLPAHYDLDPVGDVMVLAPMHRGPVGIDAFNEALRERLNPHGEAVPGTGLRLGDSVVQTKNNHEALLMNGERGVLVHHDRGRDRVILACDDGRRLRLSIAEAQTLRLAYCTSVHKAQGSQAPVVVVVLHRGHHLMLTRNLLYTAVTRATRACIVVGDDAALHTALGRRDAHKRHTRLAQLVTD